MARERGVDVAQLNGTGPGGRIITADVPETAAAPGVPARARRLKVVSPLVRRDAAAAGVDLGTVVATGPGGKVLRSDVLSRSGQAAAGRCGRARGGSRPGHPADRNARRHRVADARELAGDGAAHTGHRGGDGRRGSLAGPAQGAVVAGRDPGADDHRPGGPGAALALREHPRLNASVHDNAIHVQPEINVGIAVALEEGLIVPVVKRADQLPLSAIAAESRRFAQGARSGRLALPDLEGGTFTVSTLGTYGIDFFTPVITPGQVAILGVGRLRDSVRWEGATPVRTQVLTLSITFDHRAVDGAPAADYLRSVVSRLANPLSLLA